MWKGEVTGGGGGEMGKDSDVNRTLIFDLNNSLYTVLETRTYTKI